jgi:hypothetical protein
MHSAIVECGRTHIKQGFDTGKTPRCVGYLLRQIHTSQLALALRRSELTRH